MADFFASPRLADLVLAVLLVEVVWLGARRARTSRGPTLRRAAPFLLSGAALALTLRAVLAQAAWPWVASGLLCALVLHLWDLSERSA
jgi:hypothetical protein